jgi:hypothetical protein
LAEEKYMVIKETETDQDNSAPSHDHPTEKKVKGFVDMKRMSTIRLVPVLR